MCKSPGGIPRNAHVVSKKCMNPRLSHVGFCKVGHFLLNKNDSGRPLGGCFVSISSFS